MLIYPFPNKPWILRVCTASLLKTLWEKKKLRYASNISFSQCFLSIWRTLYHFHQIWSCRMQGLSIWKSLKFVVSEWIKTKWSESISCFTQQHNFGHVKIQSVCMAPMMMRHISEKVENISGTGENAGC